MLFAFLVLSVFFEIQANITAKLFHNNMPGLHLYTLIEMIIFSFVYYFNWSSKKILRLLIVVNAIVFIAIAIADAFFINGLKAPNTNSRPYAAVSLAIYALVYFYDLFNADSHLYSWQQPMFWFSLSVLLYFGLNTFYFMLANYLFNTYTIGSYTHAAINIVSNCLIAQAFKCHRRSTTKS
jgi:hypothetical protein